jgi:hypothetical protein
MGHEAGGHSQPITRHSTIALPMVWRRSKKVRRRDGLVEGWCDGLRRIGFPAFTETIRQQAAAQGDGRSALDRADDPGCTRDRRDGSFQARSRQSVTRPDGAPDGWGTVVGSSARTIPQTVIAPGG